MRRGKIWLGLLALAAAGAAELATLARQDDASDVVVHEWGTFLAMSGSDGVVLDGMYHEEHALPAFVHARSRDGLRLPSVVLKGETPVIYFYTDRPQKVRVDVRFPRGVWTQWYPQAQILGPQLAQMGDPGPDGVRDGRIHWCAEILPASAGRPSPEPPATSADALWNHAREVDAAYVRTPDYTHDPARPEVDRFLFYRGLGTAALPLRVAADDGGTLELDRESRHGVAHLFVVRVEDGRGTYAYLPSMEPGDRRSGVIPSMAEARPLEAFADDLGGALRGRLVASGLFEKEAAAMVNTWRSSYFLTEGVRVLFVLPQSWTDGFIPLTIEPRPREVVRVMVGRVELLTPERERRAEQAVRELASPEPAAREAAFAFLREQGRYVEPVVRRVLRTTADEELKALCQQLLATDFVTELRAAIHDAADGRRLEDDPEHVRAQLALLLKQIGLDEPAKAEGGRVLETLRGRPRPRLNDHEARHPLRAYARAAEAVGDDAAAVEGYARFVDFASQAVTTNDCRGCHRDAGPADSEWFRDWWAGERYADLLSRLGGLERAVADQEAAIARDPGDAASRLRLAYLLERSGDRARAASLWADLARRGDSAVAVRESGGAAGRGAR